MPRGMIQKGNSRISLGEGNISKRPLVSVSTVSLSYCWSTAETLASIEKCHFINLFPLASTCKSFCQDTWRLPNCWRQTSSSRQSPHGCWGGRCQTSQSISALPCPLQSPLGTRTHLLNYFLPPTLTSFPSTTLQQPATNNSLPVFGPPPHSPAVSTRAYVLFGFLEWAILSPAKKNLWLYTLSEPQQQSLTLYVFKFNLISD